jgi:hypothetical protein
MELESEIEEQELQHALGGGTATPAPLEVALKASNKAKVVDGRDEKDSLLRKRQEVCALPKHIDADAADEEHDDRPMPL